MKTEFKVGDRVRALGQPTCGSFDCPSMEGDNGTVRGISPEGFVILELDSDYGKDSFVFHPRQLVRLKPKKRAKFVCPNSARCVNAKV